MATKLLNTFFIALPILIFTLFLNFSNNPPNGRTGAPNLAGGNEPTCTVCHAPPGNQTFDGNISIVGLPNNIEPDTNYPITVKIKKTAGNPVKAGFQLVVLDDNNENFGILNATGTNTDLETSGGRTYVEHRPAKNFVSDSVEFNFEWHSPLTTNGELVTMYAAGNIASGSGNSNDLIVTTNTSGVMNTVGSSLSVTITDFTDATCFMDNDGSATALASGGSGNYTYLWSNNATTPTITGLEAGFYGVTVTDTDDNSTESTSVIISHPPQLITSALVNNNITCEFPFGSATAAVSGGVPDYSFLWSSGETTQTAFNFTIGVHFVTVTDANGCEVVDQFEIFEDTASPIADAGVDISMDCGNQGPQFTLNGQGSSQGDNFTYFWTTSNGQILSGVSTLTPEVNGPGTYTLMVTNVANGCTASDNVIVFENFAPPIANAGEDTAICHGACVTITATATEGTAPYNFEWNTGQTGATIDVCPNFTSTYIVTVTGENGCSSTDEVTISVESIPFIEINANDCTADQLTYVVNLSTDAHQIETTTGDVADLGSGNFTISNIPIDTASILITAINLNAGCVTEMEVMVPDCECPEVDPPTSLGDHFICINDNIPTLAVQPPVGYTTDWYDAATDGNLILSGSNNYTPSGAGTYFAESRNLISGCTSDVRTAVLLIINDVPIVEIVGSSSICENDCVIIGTNSTNFASYSWSNGDAAPFTTVCTPETYSVTVTDANGCTATASFTLSELSSPSADAGEDVSITCQTPQVEIGDPNAPTGGGIVHSWSNGADTPSQVVDEPGTYILNVLDQSTGCEAQDTVIVSGNVEIPIVDAGPDTTLSCTTGEITLTGTSSSPNSSFTWLHETDIFPGASITVTQKGTYILSVTNLDNGCFSSDTVEVLQQQIPEVTVTEINPVLCNGESTGSITIEVTGGEPPYTYLWPNGNTTPIATNLPAGTYIPTVTDNQGCEITTMATISEPPALTLILNSTEETSNGANNGTASANISGGTAPYEILWNTGADAPTILGLGAGDYFITVTDANGCQVTGNVSVTVSGCSELAATSTGVTSICPGSESGSLEITSTSGGTAPYNYNWSNGESGSSIENLSGGIYSCTITDDNNCELVLAFGIVEEDIEAPVLITQNLTLQLDENGNASYSPSDIDGGSTDNCGIDSFYVDITVFDCEDIGDNEIQVVVFDTGNLCDTGTAIVTVQDLIPPVFISCPDNIVSQNCTEVTYELPTASDNCGTPDIQLINGMLPGSTFPIGQTEVQFQAIDAGGNMVNCDFTVIVEPDLEVIAQVEPTACFGEPVTATLTANGGTPPYNFLWETGSTEPDILVSGTATIGWSVTDSLGCSEEGDLSVVFPEPITISIETTPEIDMNQNGTADATVTGGTPPYSYLWIQDGDIVVGSSEDMDNLIASDYCLIVTDANGCMADECEIVDLITDTHTPELKNVVSISPNPASDKLFIQFEEFQQERVLIQLFNLGGKKVLEKEKFPEEDLTTINISAFPAGVYFTRIMIENQFFVEKVIFD